MPISTLGLYGLQAGLSGISSLFGMGAEQQRFKNQKKLIDFQFQKNLEMWNKNNEYNSPAAQVQRFQQAGLNPALIYGNGSASAGNSTSVPEYGLPNAPDYSAQIQNLEKGIGLDSMIKARQLEGMQKENEGKEIRNQIWLLDKGLKSNELALSDYTLDSDMKTKIEENKLKILNLQNQYSLGQNQILLAGQQFTLNAQQMMLNDGNIQFLKQRTRLTGYQANQAGIILSWLGINMQDQHDEVRSRIANNYANARQANAFATSLEIKNEIDRTLKEFRIGAEKKSTLYDLNIKKWAGIHGQQQAFMNELNYQRDLALAPHVINSAYFSALTAEQQYYIIQRYGMKKAHMQTLGSDPFSQMMGTSTNLSNTLLGPIIENHPLAKMLGAKHWLNW